MKKLFLTICWVKHIEKNKFAKAVLNKNVKALVVNKFNLTTKIIVYHIQKSCMPLLLIKKAIILTKYFDFADIQ